MKKKTRLKKPPEEGDPDWGDLLRPWCSTNLVTESQVTWLENRPNQEPFFCPDPNSGLNTLVESPRDNHLSGPKATYDDVEMLVIETFWFS